MRLLLSTLIAFVLTESAIGQTFPYVLPWNDTTSTVIDLSGHIDKPAGKDGFVTVRDGHLYSDSKRLKLWGVNLSWGACFPETTDAPIIARRMSKFGINAVRFATLDAFTAPKGFWASTSPDRNLAEAQLQKLDYFVYQLAQNGIYSYFCLMLGRPFNRGSDLPAAIDSVKLRITKRALGFFDMATCDLQKKLARDLLIHVNPYTGNAYINEPALVFLDINNENGLIQAWMSKYLDSLPGYYFNSLNSQWNNWLSKRYADHAALKSAWNAREEAPGAEILVNGDFNGGTTSSWRLEQNGGAVAAASVDNVGPSGSPALQINITTAGTAGWHIQIGQTNLTVSSLHPYTLSFKAKASSARTITANLGMAASPWANLGLKKEVALTTEWRTFVYTFIPDSLNISARVLFSAMGANVGTVYMDDISLKTGGSIGLVAGETLTARNMRSFLREGDTCHTSDALKDWLRFLRDTEESYWISMRNYIRVTLGAHALLFGTIMGCSTPNLLSSLDVVDYHSYWTHPTFPTGSWSSIDWYVLNSAMVNHPSKSTVAEIGVRRLLNKPMAITEYQHPHPNTFSAEAFPLLSVFSGFHDYDAVFAFDYCSRTNDWGARNIYNYFNMDQNPIQMASFISSSAAFLRGDILPANQRIVVSIGREFEIDKLVNSTSWRLVNASLAGVKPLEALLHSVAIAVEGQAVPVGSLPGGATVSGTVFTSDTKEIVWDTTNAGRGLVKVDAPRSKFMIGYSGASACNLGDWRIEPPTTIQNGFCVIGITSMDGLPLSSARKTLITALGAVKNTGAAWQRYPGTTISFPPAEDVPLTFGTNWGSGPTEIEGVGAVITTPYSASQVKAWALDTLGKRKSELTIVSQGGFAKVSLSPGFKAVWYELQVGFNSTPIPDQSALTAQFPGLTIFPFSGGFNLIGPENVEKTIAVYDIRGKHVSAVSSKQSLVKYTNSKLAKGMYLVRAVCGAYTKTFKFMIVD